MIDYVYFNMIYALSCFKELEEQNIRLKKAVKQKTQVAIFTFFEGQWYKKKESVEWAQD